ncbi:MAG: type II toxin-antitoxin system VapC family toxin, partial [Steroidobacteraceae bacterium]
MTADKVVDASAIAAIMFNEPRHAFVRSRLAGVTCHAPDFIEVELASVCLKKIRSALYPPDVLIAMFSTFGGLVIATTHVNLSETIILAERTGLSAYDASYLWLAREMCVELVTLDNKLRNAA